MGGRKEGALSSRRYMQGGLTFRQATRERGAENEERRRGRRKKKKKKKKKKKEEEEEEEDQKMQTRNKPQNTLPAYEQQESDNL